MNESNDSIEYGKVSAVNGSLIEVKGFEKKVKLRDLIKISNLGILGEILQIHSDRVIVQCYETPYNLKIGEKVVNLKEPLSMELAPGLLANIFDGIQRPLDVILNTIDDGAFLRRGIEVPSLSRTKHWHFIPKKNIDEKVSGGDIIGTVQETELIEHRIMIPPNELGTLTYISSEGDYTIEEMIYRLKNNDKEKSFSMLQKWPITDSRPFNRKLNLTKPLLTGTRVIDLLFPVAKGGSVAVPGGFGTGKTVIQQSLAKWSDADIIIYIGCGERGNEIADVLNQFVKLIDPRTKRPLIERIVLIANTSNMPVSAREASIFSGVTIGQYYRDMGYDVALLADSTSRWAESLREISGLLEEIPAEEGYPAYLTSKISTFYEKAGVVHVFGSEDSSGPREGSLTIISSVSPPSGDFSEPITATTKRFIQAFWALDANLAYAKHYPAVNWLNSYSNYTDYLYDWWLKRDINWSEIDIDWRECRNQVNYILSKENTLKNIAQLTGEENLPEDQQLELFIAKIIREAFLIQNAFDKIDSYTDIKKMLGTIKLILLLYKEAKNLITLGILVEDIKEMAVIHQILRININISNEEFPLLIDIKNELVKEIEKMKIPLKI